MSTNAYALHDPLVVLFKFKLLTLDCRYVQTDSFLNFDWMLCFSSKRFLLILIGCTIRCANIWDLLLIYLLKYQLIS
ncbi:hypothetical protein T03_17362 [Trichinella britovi]|uniref:Uncharacterized protein n=1 Tax=Trichinella britovi TaxID=45882 RepID=A0A0V1D9S8_TRIBR|nr:hypothetical protein T03_17362 [Trichinella britovi]